MPACVPHLGAVAKAYVIGREAAAFARQLPGIETEICTDMARAVQARPSRRSRARWCCLAPAAASFDQYDNFERRGEDFMAQVRAYLG